MEKSGKGGSSSTESMFGGLSVGLDAKGRGLGDVEGRS